MFALQNLVSFLIYSPNWRLRPGAYVLALDPSLLIVCRAHRSFCRDTAEISISTTGISMNVLSYLTAEIRPTCIFSYRLMHLTRTCIYFMPLRCLASIIIISLPVLSHTSTKNLTGSSPIIVQIWYHFPTRTYK